ncbi:UNVERIFIED_CONTAM: hypothetical protein FKN15_052382 [Acipenser sinensis]
MRRSPQSGVWSRTGSTYLSINRDSYKFKALAGRQKRTAQHSTAHRSSHPSPHPGSVWHSLPTLLNKHFSPADAVRVWSSFTR